MLKIWKPLTEELGDPSMASSNRILSSSMRGIKSSSNLLQGQPLVPVPEPQEAQVHHLGAEAGREEEGIVVRRDPAQLWRAMCRRNES